MPGAQWRRDEDELTKRWHRSAARAELRILRQRPQRIDRPMRARMADASELLHRQRTAVPVLAIGVDELGRAQHPLPVSHARVARRFGEAPILPLVVLGD